MVKDDVHVLQNETSGPMAARMSGGERYGGDERTSVCSVQMVEAVMIW